jgi:hypothetical protein
MIEILIDRLKAFGDEFLTFKHVDALQPNLWADVYYIKAFERLKLYATAKNYPEFRLSLNDIEEIEKYKGMMYFAIEQWELQNDD